MALQRYAIVFGSSVVNVVEYESEPTTPPPGYEDGHFAIQSDIAGPNWTYENGQLVQPQPIPSPIPIPLSNVTCTPWQFRAELRARGMFDEVEQLVAASSIAAQDAFEFATSFDSDNELLLALAAQLSTPLTPDQVYDMILSASTRVVGLSQ